MKKFILILLCFIPFFVRAEVTLATNARAALLLEASTGEIIFSKNPHEKLEPASLTKMMSMLLIVEAIDKSVLSWNQVVTVSAHASSMGGSQILLETNERMTVEDLFKGIAIASGNELAVSIKQSLLSKEEIII